ncbi:MAG TPA: large conductance mechanosensitive channel protein MscL [Miltoncostaeaceae bacterium]|nr:large conductance mechanosensitive channel protein MscL [Miltoncostaeaceae bacterium]
MSWWGDFKAWIQKGNLLEVAVALVIALAFTALVKAFITDLITPLIAAIFGKPDFSQLTFTINDSTFKYGDFINVLVYFILVAFVLFWVMRISKKLMRDKPAEPPEYAVEALDVAALNRRAEDGWTIVGASDGQVLLEKS